MKKITITAKKSVYNVEKLKIRLKRDSIHREHSVANVRSVTLSIQLTRKIEYTQKKPKGLR